MNPWAQLPAPPPEGVWTLELDEVPTGAYDIGLISPFNVDGRLLYFMPLLRVDSDPETSQITIIEVQFAYWDPVEEAYEIISASSGLLPIVGPYSADITLEADFSNVSLTQNPNGTWSPDSPVYFDEDPDPALQLGWITIGYMLGGVGYYFQIGLAGC